MSTNRTAESNLESRLDEFADLAVEIGRVYQECIAKMQAVRTENEPETHSFARFNTRSGIGLGYSDMLASTSLPNIRAAAAYETAMVAGLKELGLDDYILKDRGVGSPNHMLRMEIEGGLYQLDMRDPQEGIWELEKRTGLYGVLAFFGFIDEYEMGLKVRETAQDSVGN